MSHGCCQFGWHWPGPLGATKLPHYRYQPYRYQSYYQRGKLFSYTHPQHYDPPPLVALVINAFVQQYRVLCSGDAATRSYRYRTTGTGTGSTEQGKANVALSEFGGQT